MVPVRNDGVDELPAGLPVYVAGAGLAAPARADSETASQVFGLLTQALPGSGMGWAMLNGGYLNTVSDWTAVIGAAALDPGKVYYLGREGGLSLEAPAEIIVPTIRAFTTTEALIQIQPGIQLGSLL